MTRYFTITILLFTLSLCSVQDTLPKSPSSIYKLCYFTGYDPVDNIDFNSYMSDFDYPNIPAYAITTGISLDFGYGRFRHGIEFAMHNIMEVNNSSKNIDLWGLQAYYKTYLTQSFKRLDISPSLGIGMQEYFVNTKLNSDDTNLSSVMTAVRFAIIIDIFNNHSFSRHYGKFLRITCGYIIPFGISDWERMLGSKDLYPPTISPEGIFIQIGYGNSGK
jgi:hypothetical protein